ncbi:MAG: flagellin lysine-N-methylase [Oscillospiraceae bacterium]|nr:flagellin lysine-N-methylase [Oscillospiraceae bacterium]
MSNKINIQYFRQPKFYKDFQCAGDKCPVNCCYGWGIIGWKKEEYEKIKNAKMPMELRSKFENSFKPTENERYKGIYDYQIEYTNERKCPLLTENGLCRIQKELGADYLSHVCMVYPRNGYHCGNTILRTCQLSCVHVMKKICNDENSMELENNFKVERIDFKPDYETKDYINYPHLKYHRELFEFFYELLSDKTHSIETSIVLGAMAAQKIDDFIKKRQHDRIPEIIKALKPQLNNPAQIEKLENAKPNISLKGNVAFAVLKALKDSNIYQNIFENGNPSEEKWQEGMDKWNAVFKDRPYVLRNIALNLYISQSMPFRDKTLSLFENFCYLAAEMCVIKFLAAAVSIQFDRTEEMFEIAVSNVDREFTHNDVNVKTVIDVLHAFGINSPAYLMGILK